MRWRVWVGLVLALLCGVGVYAYLQWQAEQERREAEEARAQAIDAAEHDLDRREDESLDSQLARVLQLSEGGLIEERELLQTIVSILAGLVDESLSLTWLDEGRVPLVEEHARFVDDSLWLVGGRGGLVRLRPSGFEHYWLERGAVRVDQYLGRHLEGVLEDHLLASRSSSVGVLTAHGAFIGVPDRLAFVGWEAPTRTLWLDEGADGRATACGDAVIVSDSGQLTVRNGARGTVLERIEGSLLACGPGGLAVQRGDALEMLEDGRARRLTPPTDLSWERRDARVIGSGLLLPSDERWVLLRPGARAVQGAGLARAFGDERFLVELQDRVAVRDAAGTVLFEQPFDGLTLAVPTASGIIGLAGEQGAALWRPAEPGLRVLTDRSADSLGFDRAGRYVAWGGPEDEVRVVSVDGSEEGGSPLLGPSLPGDILVAPDGRNLVLYGPRHLSVRGLRRGSPVPLSPAVGRRVYPREPPEIELDSETREAVAAWDLSPRMEVAAVGGGRVVLEGHDSLEVRRVADGLPIERWEARPIGFHTSYPPTDPTLTDDGRFLIVRSFGDQSHDHMVLYRFVEDGQDGEALERVLSVEGTRGAVRGGRLAVRLGEGLVARYPVTWTDALADACAHLGTNAPGVCVGQN